MKALIVIDYTNDFIASDGALTCGLSGQQIEEPIVSLVASFVSQGDYVVFATDKHELNDQYHPETKLYPPHNIEHTAGRAFFGKLAEQAEHSGVYVMDKRRYSSFAGTDLDLRLRERGIKEVHLCGVCTDICILHTAIEAYHLGYEIVIHEQAVASFDEAGHAYALKHFKNVLGAKVVD